MTHDGYDAYEVTSWDGTQQLCTANTLAEVRLAAHTQVAEGHARVLYGPTDFERATGSARKVWGEPRLYERTSPTAPWLEVELPA